MRCEPARWIWRSSPPFRPPDTGVPALDSEVLAEHELLVAAPVEHELAAHDPVPVAELAGWEWVASRSGADESLLGVWPGLAEQPRDVHVVRDWLTKLHLVRAGGGLTTVPALLVPALPEGVRALRVSGSPRERRRIMLLRSPAADPGSTTPVVEALRRAAGTLAG